MGFHRVLLAAILAAALPGCESRTIRWSEEAPLVQPERQGNQGYLSVEEIDPLVWSARGRRMKGAPFLLYDDRGRYLTRYNDPYLPPVAVDPGRYIVVVRVEGEDRQIQVLVRRAQLTLVDLSRLEGRTAPEVPAEPAESLPESR